MSIPNTEVLTIDGVSFAGGVARGVSSGPCSPPLTVFQGLVLQTRLVIRADAPAQAYTTLTLPAGVMAVGFDSGINSDPVTSRIQVVLVTSDNKEQTFSITALGAGSGGSRRLQPVFAGFTSSRSITSIRLSIPDITDSNLVLDDFVTAQTKGPSVTATGGVMNAASFLPTVAANTYIAIFGRLLSGVTRIWSANDFSGAKLPAAVEDVSVTINSKPAYVYYVSLGQLNVLTPVELEQGPATLEVSRGDLKSPPVTVQVQRIAPALFAFDPENRRYAAVSRNDGSFVGKTSLYPGATTPARPGEIIILWGNGFGPTSPAIPAGEIVAVPSRITGSAVVTIGGVAADVLYAGLSGAGLYQINVKVPDGVPDGDLPLSVQIDSARTQDGLFVTVQRQ